MNKREYFIGTLFAVIVFLFGVADCLLAKEINLVKMQKKEMERRARAATAKISVTDDNLDWIRIEGSTGHCSQFATTVLPSADSQESSSWAAPESEPTVVSSHRAKQDTSRRLEEEIRQAEANVALYEKKIRSFINPEEYRMAIKELERWIDGEKYFIYFTKQKLQKL